MLGLPPNAHAKVVLMNAVETMTVGSANFKSCIRKIHAHLSAGSALRIYLNIRAACGIVGSIADRNFFSRYCISTDHAACAAAGVHIADAVDQRSVQKIAYPDRCESLVVGSERS